MKKYFTLIFTLFNARKKGYFYIHSSGLIWSQWRLCAVSQSPGKKGTPTATQHKEPLPTMGVNRDQVRA